MKLLEVILLGAAASNAADNLRRIADKVDPPKRVLEPPKKDFWAGDNFFLRFVDWCGRVIDDI